MRNWRIVENFVPKADAVPNATTPAESRLEHPCQLFRMCPWTFPRAYSGSPTAARHEVETTDLLLSCPTWSCTSPEPFPLRRSMQEFRQRWSHLRVTVADPINRDYGNAAESLAFWGCQASFPEFSGLIWLVVGPILFLNELKIAASGPSEFPEGPRTLVPGPTPTSLYLCRHEIECD
jgi:hypothetical protein